MKVESNKKSCKKLCYSHFNLSINIEAGTRWSPVSNYIFLQTLNWQYLLELITARYSRQGKKGLFLEALHRSQKKVYIAGIFF